MSTQAATLVDVRKVQGRRSVHFEQPEDILAEAEKLAQGPIRQLGNLSLGQTCGHLAEWMELSIDGGIPLDAPWWLKLVARSLKRLMLSRPLMAGYRLPPKAEAVLIPAADTAAAAGIEHLRSALLRLRSESRRVPSPLLGPLSVEEWNRLHCRHAELHFSFLLPGTGTA